MNDSIDSKGVQPTLSPHAQLFMHDPSSLSPNQSQVPEILQFKSLENHEQVPTSRDEVEEHESSKYQLTKLIYINESHLMTSLDG